MRLLPVLVVAALLAAGCGGPSSKEPGALQAVDGEGALGYVKAFSLRDDATPRYRIPGTEGQREGADFLWRASEVPGWERTWQNFTGVDYQALDRRTVSSYTVPSAGNDPAGGGQPRGCTQAESDTVPTLTFSNLLVVRRAEDPAAPLVLIGAHWDSQMHSDFDPDPAKRDSPDPGANDGASGVGLLLQLMRELDEQRPDLPVSVGLFFIDGEDGFFDCYPLAGSLYFAQNQPFDVSAFILLDMVGDPGALFPREGYSRNSAPELLDLLWSHGQAIAPEHFVDTRTSIQDDHVALIAAGIPSVDIIDAGRPTTFPPQWDTTGDTVEKLDPVTLGKVGDVLLATLDDPALIAILQA